MTKMKYFVGIAFHLIVLVLLGCNNNGSASSAKENKGSNDSTGLLLDRKLPKNNQTINESHFKNTSVEYNCEECLKLVNRIVSTSNYSDFFKKKYQKNYTFLINEETKQKVSIQIIIGSNVPMGWLELNLEEETLNDVTNDPLQPIQLHANDSLIKEFKDNCMECCLD
jgi:hypothetical protein